MLERYSHQRLKAESSDGRADGGAVQRRRGRETDGGSPCRGPARGRAGDRWHQETLVLTRVWHADIVGVFNSKGQPWRNGRPRIGPRQYPKSTDGPRLTRRSA